MLDLALIFVALLLVAVCGIFVAAEFSFLAVNRNTVEQMARRGDQGAGGVLRALKTLSTQLSGAQLGITLTNLAIGFLAQPVIADLFDKPLRALGTPESWVPKIAIVIGISIATAVTMLFGELVPKNLAITKPLGTAKLVQWPHRFFTSVTGGPIRLLNNSANFILRRLGVEPQEELASARSADELLSLVRRSAEKGTLSKDTAIMMERSLNFGDQTALDVMTPRLQVEMIDDEDTVADVLELAKRTGHSRFPVMGEGPDDILGVVHIKHALAVPRERRPATAIREILQKAVFIPSGLQLEPLLEQLRQGGLQMAIVIDEFGGTDGVVTMEDLLEELVGEVEDEHDQHSLDVRELKNGSWILSGLLRPDEVGEDVGIALPEHEEYETLGGLIAYHLERLPDTNDQVEVAAVDRGGIEVIACLRVQRMDGRRVDRIRLTVKPKPDDDEGAEE